jgi:DNA-binding NtrC family response regulator
MTRPRGATASWRRIALLVESDSTLSKILQRELRSRTVIAAGSVASALRILEAEPRIDVVISAYRLEDGTARRLFAHAKQRWPHVRRILCDEKTRLERGHARSAIALADDVVADFSQLRRIAG